MTEALFDAIVEALLAICAATGWTYSEINILIYCGLIPATWCGIVYLRQRRWLWLVLLHVMLPAIYYFERERFAKVSEKFYDANIRALNWLGEASGLGYIGISLVIGLAIPILIYMALYGIAKRWLLACYVVLLAGNLGWYLWALKF